MYYYATAYNVIQSTCRCVCGLYHCLQFGSQDIPNKSCHKLIHFLLSHKMLLKNAFRQLCYRQFCLNKNVYTSVKNIVYNKTCVKNK